MKLKTHSTQLNAIIIDQIDCVHWYTVSLTIDVTIENEATENKRQKNGSELQ